LLPLASELQSDHLAVTAKTGYIQSGVPTRLVIPAIALDSEVIPVGWQPAVIDGITYSQWNAADALVGWHNRSAKLGQVGNTVLNGHSDVNTEIFRNLKYVEIGDEITVFSGERDYRYTVTEKFLVEEKEVPLEERLGNAKWIAGTPDERLTLVTCANPGATHRLIVIARPAPHGG
jgi:LPXTG-site transpeptidase (sortase) family protein